MDDLKAIVDTLKREDNFLITSHIRPEGDSIGSQLALYQILKKLGKKVKIINEDPVPEANCFLPQSETIKPFSEKLHQFDVAVILDCGDWERVGKVASLARKAKTIINIDHHPDTTGLGKYNYIDPQASSAAEQLYKIFELSDFKLDYDTALCLYVGILVDTGNFHHPNTSSEVHRIVADLMEYGIKPQEVMSLLYEAETPSSVRLYGLVLSTLKMGSEDKVAWCEITKEAFKATGAKPSEIDSERIFGQLRSIKGTQVILLFMEMKDKVKVSLRSRAGLDISQVARGFGGGGHHQAAGCVVEGKLEEIEKKVLAQVNKLLRRADA